MTKESRRSIDRSMGEKQTKFNLCCSSVRRPVPLLLVLTPQAPKPESRKKTKQAKNSRECDDEQKALLLRPFVVKVSSYRLVLLLS